ncbi:hypothetical protein DCAR_0102468 [Daucus carota subsp. sativus]|uniref:Uncharacterized protein n=1 Tax=Daucus carota subsp. sativus TaxID=79200 RepID=A0AAF1AI32_DAUCS|nr:hypothetical protein DCAR_0102468 [Daucus carota subsp. sativus]
MLYIGKSSIKISADRWGGLGKGVGIQNFELHAFRAAFQMVLFQYYPKILVTSPAIGCQGKAFAANKIEGHWNYYLSLSPKDCKKNFTWMNKNAETEVTLSENLKGPDHTDGMIQKVSSKISSGCEKTTYAEKYMLFKKFIQSALDRLGVHCLKEVDLAGLWKKNEPFAVTPAISLILFFLHLRPYLTLTCTLEDCLRDAKYFVERKDKCYMITSVT